MFYANYTCRFPRTCIVENLKHLKQSVMSESNNFTLIPKEKDRIKVQNVLIMSYLHNIFMPQY